MFARSEDAKKGGWFSRRHKTNEVHQAAKDARERKRDARRNRERGGRALSEATPREDGT